MPYEMAANWKGEYLPHGDAGMPANHPYPFTYARPRYLGIRRGFGRGLGAGGTMCSMSALPQCSEADIVGFNLLGSFGVSAPCTIAQQQCNAKIVATPPAPVLTSPSTPGVGVAVGCNCVIDPVTGIISTSPCGAGQVPTAADYACVAQAVSNAQVKAQQQLNAGQVQQLPCAYETDNSGNCCAQGQTIDANGNCSSSFSMPWWGWVAIIGGGVLLVVRR